MRGDIWPAQDEALMRAHYANIGSDAMHRDHLPHRTPRQIRNRAAKLKLRYTGPRLGGGVCWTPDEIATLRLLYPVGGAEAVKVALQHRSLASIRNQAWTVKIPHASGCGSPKKGDFTAVPVHNYTDEDRALMAWRGPVSHGLVGMRLAV